MVKKYVTSDERVDMVKRKERGDSLLSISQATGYGVSTVEKHLKKAEMENLHLNLEQSTELELKKAKELIKKLKGRIAELEKDLSGYKIVLKAEFGK